MFMNCGRPPRIRGNDLFILNNFDKDNKTFTTSYADHGCKKPAYNSPTGGSGHSRLRPLLAIVPGRLVRDTASVRVPGSEGG